ncbi:MAG: hypothetical protein VX764_02345 [Planctomycetota bacterium]|nr:hypothetical protein [Planctomycetota bacterium]
MLKSLLAAILLLVTPVVIATDLAETLASTSEERFAGDDRDKRYIVHGSSTTGKTPKKGFGLLVVLPGGGGGADFRNFVENIGKNSTGPDWLTVQLVSKMWTPEQKIIWPTETNRVKKQRFTTEQFIDQVIADVARKNKIDRHRVVLLGWSSSGPALYAHALRKKSVVSRYLVAMSVFRPKYLPPIQLARGKSFFLYHSREDQVCPFADAERAGKDLRAAGARLEILEYEGGHGWRGNVYGNIKKGIDWLTSK